MRISQWLLTLFYTCLSSISNVNRFFISFGQEQDLERDFLQQCHLLCLRYGVITLVWETKFVFQSTFKFI